ncbi:hypothetical protein K4F52_000457 [Lecanicillium sp. MT-2017a]|nr:hypothetical protein K4F52_000457 [Lecanicillium sp. MT-2017a]
MKFIITTLLFGGALALPATTGYDPCPGSGLQGNPTCCELNLAGVIAGECIAPDRSPTSGPDFEKICSENGRSPVCCLLNDVLNLAAGCSKPVGVSQ